MPALTTGRLPVRLTPLVGRDAELGQVTRALAASRLLTLTGPGGTGKTRLALATAAEVAAAADVVWIELAPLDSAQLIAPTVAVRLGVPETPGADPAAAIAAHLAARNERRLLVVLDNCEHVAAAAASLTEYLLAECPRLSVLATSREPLGVEGERSWPVPPLGRQAAVRLFEDRARLVAPSFEISDANRDAVAGLCAKLDGLPLAIELAAARMRVLSVRQLAERLDDVFGVLTGGARSAPPRHQALRAALDWSHDLLTPAERAAFRRLAVFGGGFSLAAAERVVSFGAVAPADVLDLLTRLADKSLVRVESERYHLLATIREYAAEALAAAAELDQARLAHLAYFTEFAEQAGARVEAAAAAGLEAELDGLDAERANLRAASEFARQRGDAVAALRIAGQLGRYAYLRGHYHEVRQWMDLAVAAGQAAPPQLRARALFGSGRLAYLQCDYQPAVRRLDAALLLYRSLGDAAGAASCLQALGSVAREQGRYVRSSQLHTEGLDLARSCGDERAAASAHSYLGFVSWLQGDFDLAVERCTDALTLLRALGDAEGTAWSLISLGVVARYRRELTRSAALLAESLELSRSIGFREGIAWCEEQLGLVALAEGAVPQARARLRASFAIHRDLRDRWRMASVLEDLAAAELQSAVGQPPAGPPGAARAAYLLGVADALRDAIGTVLAPCERRQHDHAVAAATAALGQEAFEAARDRGRRAANPDEALDEAARIAAPDAEPASDAPSDVVPARGSSADVMPGRDASSGVVPARDASSDVVLARGASAGVMPGRDASSDVVLARDASSGAVPARDASSGAVPAVAAATPPSEAAATPSSAADAPSAPAPLTVRALGAASVLLGDVELTPASWGYAKPRELLFLLVTSPPLTREQIGAALWPELSRQQLGNALHTALRELRRALGDPTWVVYSGGRYSFNRTRPHACDVDAFESALAAAGRIRPPADALAHLQQAVAAYGGDFLAGASAGEWAQARREELRRRFESALLAVGRLQVAAGRLAAAVTAFRRAIEHEPLNESAHRELMTCWDALGQTARAVRHYAELEALLASEVGVRPAPETTALYERLLGRG
ncbi:MAG TPA: BTAD domain-containing putative transcriptional regulator [Trebonia sp.]|jgi:predicted ATPase/DNA-binding SARP family transcriptional activator|nr:BTAD domain-containing putative transcriptional regulator [Trebonia sp.]